jgi:hypothetical protein
MVALGKAHQHADTPHPIRLLSAPSKRPRGRCTADERDDVPSPHGPSLARGLNPTTFALSESDLCGAGK